MREPLIFTRVRNATSPIQKRTFRTSELTEKRQIDQSFPQLFPRGWFQSQNLPAHRVLIAKRFVPESPLQFLEQAFRPLPRARIPQNHSENPSKKSRPLTDAFKLQSLFRILFSEGFVLKLLNLIRFEERKRNVGFQAFIIVFNQQFLVVQPRVFFLCGGEMAILESENAAADRF